MNSQVLSKDILIYLFVLEMIKNVSRKTMAFKSGQSHFKVILNTCLLYVGNAVTAIILK